MVSVVNSVPLNATEAQSLEMLQAGLEPAAGERVAAAFELAREAYGEHRLGTAEPVFQHALGMALIATALDLDAEVRCAALLFAAGDHLEDAAERLKVGFGDTVAGLVDGLRRLGSLRPLTRAAASAGGQRGCRRGEGADRDPAQDAAGHGR
jgi:GTP pyrophosphokinase